MAVDAKTFTDLLNTFEFTNRIFFKKETISALDPNSNFNVIQKVWNDFTQTQVFGFVPVFDKQGDVSLYIRFGGPELIVKNFGAKGVEVDDAAFDEMYPEAKNFSNRFDTVYGGNDYINYEPIHALERLLLQRTMNNPIDDAHYPTQFKNQVMTLYPLRLVPNFGTKKFDLQYAPMGADDYSTINNANNYSNLMIEILTSLIKKAIQVGRPDDDVRELLRFCKSSDNLKVLSKAVFLDRLQKDFDSAIHANLITLFDRAGSSDNGYDTPFVAAFAQLTNAPKGSEALASAVYTKAIELKNGLPSLVNETTVTAMCPLVASYFAKWGLDSEGANQTFKDEIAAKAAEIQQLTKAKADLDAKIVAQENQFKAISSSDRNKERIIGAASAAAVTLWAMQNEDLKSLDKLQKGILIAVGGALGAVMPSGFAPLAVLAAPITATTVGKQLTKHEITAERASAKYSELKDRASAKYEELSQRRADAASRANPKRKKRKAKR
jgi:hypothetical protein